MFKRIAALLALSTLAACGGGTHSGASDKSLAGIFVQNVQGVVTARRAAPPDARAVLTADLIASAESSLLLVVNRNADAGFTMVPLSVNRGVEQWTDASGGGLLRRNGVLVGTRGLGFDLLTADVDPLLQALGRGGGQAVRVNRYLDGQNQVVAVQFICDVRRAGGQTLEYYGRHYVTTVYEEDCRGDAESFTNRYWIDRAGGIRRSEETVSPEIGVLEINQLK